MTEKRRKVAYLTTCNRNPDYPKTILRCGEVIQIKAPTTVPERLVRRNAVGDPGSFGVSGDSGSYG